MKGNISRDIRRFRKIGEENRMDLTEFIKNEELRGEDIRIPIKVVDLPTFEYRQRDMGGVGKGEGTKDGEPVDPGKPGDESGEHGYYEMDPREFAEELDDELGLNFTIKGQTVVEETIGGYNETSRSGPDSLLDKDHLVKEAIKREVALFADEEYIKELLAVRGYGVERVWEWCRDNQVSISKPRIEELKQQVDNPTKYDSVDEISRDLRRKPPKQKNLRFRSGDERYRSPEIEEKPQHNAVVINIRDVSGSMGEEKRELVERVFTPIDWYLQGKHDNIEFHYIAHDAEAWEVDRDNFFGIKSGGGTVVSSSFEKTQDILQQYPSSRWNRFIFAAGDGENHEDDTQERLIPLMKEMKKNMISYVQVGSDKSKGSWRSVRRDVASLLKDEFKDDEQYKIAKVSDKEEVISAIRYILSNGDTQ